MNKVILFVVEGISDKDALLPILDPLFTNTDIHCVIMYADITTKKTNIKAELGKKLNNICLSTDI